ncbi:hypothetical protein Tco_1530860 [Tanacetum coccineum]
MQEGIGSSNPVDGDDRLDQPVPTKRIVGVQKNCFRVKRSQDADSDTFATTDCSSPHERPCVQRYAHANSNTTHSRVQEGAGSLRPVDSDDQLG